MSEIHKKYSFVILSIMFAFLLFPSDTMGSGGQRVGKTAKYAAGLEGPAGQNSRWEVDLSKGVLALTGSGDVTGFYAEDNSPYHWQNNAIQIKEIKIEEGITSVKAGVFDRFPNVDGVYFPSGFRYDTAYGLLDSLQKLRFVYDYRGIPKYYLVNQNNGELVFCTSYFEDRMSIPLYKEVVSVDLSIFAGKEKQPKLILNEDIQLVCTGSIPDPFPQLVVYPGSQAERFLEQRNLPYTWSTFSGYDQNEGIFVTDDTDISPDTISLRDLCFSFSNNAAAFGYSTDYYFAKERFYEVYEDKDDADLLFRYKKNNDYGIWSGNCFGMCAASLLRNYRAIDFLGNKEDIDWKKYPTYLTLNPEDSVSTDCGVNWNGETMGITLCTLIERMQVGQLSFGVQEAYRDNMNNLSRILSLGNEIKGQFMSPFVVLLSFNGAKHAMTAYAKVNLSEDTTHLYVYDPNWPGERRYITLRKSGGQLVSWEYSYLDGITWKSGGKGAFITAAPASSILELMQNQGSLSYKSYNTHMTGGNANLEILNSAGQVVAKFRNGVFESYTDEIFAPLMASGLETEKDFMFYLPAGRGYRIVNQSGQAVRMVEIDSYGKITEYTIEPKNENTKGQADSIKKPFIKLNAKKVLLRKNQSTTGLKVTMAKGDCIKSVKAENSKIISVSIVSAEKGKIRIKGKKIGKTVLTIILRSGITKKITVKVQKGKVKTKKLTVYGRKTRKLKKRKKLKLKVTAAPFTSQEKVTFFSDHKNIAVVSKKGVITAKKKGKAKITVRSGRKKCVIRVKVA